MPNAPSPCFTTSVEVTRQCRVSFVYWNDLAKQISAVMTDVRVENSVSDILQVLCFSDLIDKFEGVSIENFAALSCNIEKIKDIVPEAFVQDFAKKLQRLFGEKNGSVAEDKNEGIDTDIDFDFDDQASEDESESEDVENVDYNNTNQVFDIENIDIKTILESTFEGRQIISWHKAKNFLNQGQRKRLVHFVIAGVLNICNRVLKGNDFKVLSRKIVEIFPKECELYEAGIPKRKSKTGFSKIPQGKLLWKYINLKKISKELKASKKDKKKFLTLKI